MKNLKKYLIIAVLLLLAIVFVACDGEDTPAGPAEPETVKIAKIEVYPTIYEGEEKTPYVLIGQDIYFEAELLAEDESKDPTEKEVWSIADATVAEMTVNEEGGVICKGLKAGSTTVTAKSPDGTVEASYKFEVAISKNAQDVLVATNEEIQKTFPKFIAADTVLPVPANPNVTIKYKSSITNGITVTNGTYKYAYKDNIGDVNKQINFTLTYHGQVFEGNAYFYEVKDVNNNLFTTSEKVEAKINAIFANYEKATDKDGKPIDYPLVNSNVSLPAGYTTEEVGREIGLVWASDTAKYISAVGIYTKGAADANVVLTATVGIKTKLNLTATDKVLPDLNIYINYTASYKYKDANNAEQTVEITSFKALDATMTNYFTVDGDNKYAKDGVEYYSFTPISKVSVNLVSAGTPMMDIVNYYFTSKLAPTDGQSLTSKDLKNLTYNLAASDTTKKYTGLSVEWSLDDPEETGVQIKDGKLLFKKNGEYTLKGVFYYNKRILESYFGTADTEFNTEKTYYWYDNSTKSYTKFTAVPTAEEIDAAKLVKAAAKTAMDDAKAAYDAADEAGQEAAKAAYDTAKAAYDKAEAAVKELEDKQICSNYFERKESETYLWKYEKEITITYTR